MIRKGDSIQPVAGRKLRDARAEGNPFLSHLPGDHDGVARWCIRWSHQASDTSRHWCVGALSAFRKVEAA